MIVKRLAKYLTLLLAIVISVIGHTNNGEISVATAQSYSKILPTHTALTIEAAVPNGLISPLNEVSAPQTIQLQGTTKRPNNAHRSNFEFITAGRAINTHIGNYIFKKSSTITTSFTKPEHRLIRLGKLII